MRFARFALAALSALAFANLTSCSDPVPPIPKGAWVVSFIDTGAECLIPSHNAAVGTVSANSLSKQLSDAEDGAVVACSVTGAGPFKVDAKATYQSEKVQIVIKSLPANATEAEPAMGGMVYSGKTTQGTVYGSDPMQPCAFYFAPNSGQGVSAGQVWVSFKCPKVVSNSGMSSCEIEQGYAAFNNCLDIVEE